MRLMLMVGCACIMIAVVSFALAQNAQSLITLSTSADMVQSEDEFELTIHVQDAEGVYGSSLKLAYDPQLLEVVLDGDQAVVPGDFFADKPGFPLKNGVDPVNGVIEYVLTLRQPAEPVTGSGILGTVHMRALQNGPAAIDVIEARLLSPVFEEVNGVRIAKQVDELPVSVENLAVDIGGDGVTTGILSTPLSQVVPVTEASPSQSVVMPEVSQRQPMISINVPTRGFIVAVGTLFFMIGLMLFTFSIGAYVKLRRQYSSP